MPGFTMWSNTYLNVYSYEGTTQYGAITLRMSGNGYINVPDWKLSITALPSTAANGLYFPTEKIMMQPNNTSGTAYDPGPLPTISEIGMPAAVFLMNNSEVYLVPQSNKPLYNQGVNNSYYDLKITFNMSVIGGAYLTQLKSGSPQYPVNLIFTLYGANNEIIGTTNQLYTIQIHSGLSGNPPAENEYSIQVSSAARNGLLNLMSLVDYAQGASVTYTEGLTVSTNTDYQISVKSISPVFLSSSGNSLPLDVVNIELQPSSGNQASVYVKPISSLPQVISFGKSTNKLPVHYSIRYYTSPNDLRLTQSKMDEYSTTLQYEITPQ